MDNICTLVRDQEQNYVEGTTTISKYVDFNMHEVVNTIDAYMNSVHLSGPTDAIGREKPFFNIVVAARNIWYRATDIDRKDIRLRVTKSSDVVLTLVANILLRQWMKKANFGKVLNDWGRTLATYGSAVLKFVEKDGELIVTLVPWNRLVPDVIDFDNNLKIEVLEYTPAQLRKQKGYDQEMVKQLLESESLRTDLNNQTKDNKKGYIKVYEVHGEIEKSYLTGKESDEDVYVQQMHAVTFTKGEYDRSTRSYKYDDYTLYSGQEKKDPYLKTDLISEDGKTLAVGAVQNLFESQWMTNHSVKMEKDVLDFASLMILQTADKGLVGMNVLTGLVTGDMLVYDAQQDPNGIKQVNNAHDISQIVTFGQMWQSLGREINGISEAMATGEVKAGAAWRQTQALLQESHSLFEVMKENKGLAIEEMLRKYIIPFLKTKMDTADEIGEVLQDAEVAQFDAIYVPNEARRRNNKKMVDAVLKGDIAENGDMEMMKQDVKDEMAPLGNQRFLKPSDISDKTWKEALKDFEWEPDVNPTSEDTDNQAVMETLNTMLTTAVNQPELYKFLVNKILERTGQISPVEIPNFKPQQQLSPAMVAAGQNAQSNVNPLQ
jgi:hypothetical protein